MKKNKPKPLAIGSAKAKAHDGQGPFAGCGLQFDPASPIPQKPERISLSKELSGDGIEIWWEDAWLAQNPQTGPYEVIFTITFERP